MFELSRSFAACVKGSICSTTSCMYRSLSYADICQYEYNVFRGTYVASQDFIVSDELSVST